MEDIKFTALIKEDLNVVEKSCQRLIKLFDKRPFPDPGVMFSLCLIDRIDCAAIGITSMFGSGTSHTGIEYCAGIIVRSTLLDNIIAMHATVMYMQEPDANNRNEVFNHKALWYLSDSLQHTFTFLRKMQSWQPQTIIERIKQGLIRDNRLLFVDPEAEEPELKNNSGKVITDVLMYDLRQSIFAAISAEVYELYMLYSKYDHFGYMSHSLGGKPIAGKLFMLRAACFMMVRTALLAADLLKAYYPNEVVISNISDDLKKYIQKETAALQ